MTAIKSEYFVDGATGQRYVMGKLGGATNANGDDAANVLAEITNVSSFPSKSVFELFFHGTDSLADTLTVAVATPGRWIDMSEISSDLRSIIIENGNASPDYAYDINFSRNGTDADRYTVATAAAGGKAQRLPVVIDAANYGHANFVQVEITPTAAQSGTQLQFKVYLSGRGG